MSLRDVLAALTKLEARLESRQAVTQLHGHVARDIGFDVPEDSAVHGHSALGALERHGLGQKIESDAYAKAVIKQTEVL